MKWPDRAATKNTDKVISAWTCLRRTLKKEFWKAHKDVLARLGCEDAEAPQEDADSNAFSLFSFDDGLLEGLTEAPVSKLQELQQAYTRYIADASFASALNDFQKQNPAGTRIQVLPDFRDLSDKVGKDACAKQEKDGNVTSPYLQGIVTKNLFKVIPDGWTHFCHIARHSRAYHQAD